MPATKFEQKVMKRLDELEARVNAMAPEAAQAEKPSSPPKPKAAPTPSQKPRPKSK